MSRMSNIEHVDALLSVEANHGCNKLHTDENHGHTKKIGVTGKSNEAWNNVLKHLFSCT
jgi:hypothetical protein